MKIHIETDTDAPDSTRVTLDGVDVTLLLQSAMVTSDAGTGAVKLTVKSGPRHFEEATPDAFAKLCEFWALPEPGDK